MGCYSVSVNGPVHLYKLCLELMLNRNPAPSLTGLMEVKGIQREASTLSHTPDKLQVLLIMVVVVLGQRRDWVVPAGVSGHERKSVVSALQYAQSVPAGMVR